MDNQRLILFAALSVVIVLLWQAWQKDYGPPPQVKSPTSTAESTVPSASDIPAAPAGQKKPAAAASSPASPAVAAETGMEKGERIHVQTDVFRAVIDTRGGDLRDVSFPRYPVSVDKPNQPFQLLNDDTAKIFVAQSGLLANTAAPNHHAQYHAAQKDYKLANGASELKVPLTWTSDQGITVTKTYTFHRGSYVVDVSFDVTNNGKQAWKGRQYRQFERARVGRKSRFIYTFIGGAISSVENKYEKLSFDKMQKDPLSSDLKGGWAAMVQHYFLAAWVPGQKETNHYYTKSLGDDLYVLGLSSAEKTIPAGGKGDFDSRLYVGPKLQDKLAAVAPHLELTVDYGLLTFIAKPIFWLLKHLHGLLGNWGWSIILLTMFIKLAFYKLSAASYRSMANMRRMQPKMAQLRERYGDDRQRMSQAMMELYKKEKINPLGGCLPIVIQIPVFISLYWVLLGSVELRQADFIFWIHDLSTKDPYYVLPLIMGISMFVQQRLSPAPPDPIQAKVMMALPVVFTLFFAFFPAGLVLYWIVNNVLSIAQQWYITHNLEKATAKA
ncbi:MAG: membrane protein insertase YidC [Gammaproteobacteria bacterium]